MSGKKLKILQELSLEKVSISEDQEKKKKKWFLPFCKQDQKEKSDEF